MNKSFFSTLNIEGTNKQNTHTRTVQEYINKSMSMNASNASNATYVK